MGSGCCKAKKEGNVSDPSLDTSLQHASEVVAPESVRASSVASVKSASGQANAPFTGPFPPQPVGPYRRSNFIVDTAGVIEQEDADEIMNTCDDLLRTTRIPIVVVTVTSLGHFESNISEFAIELFDKWGIGHNTWNVGILLLCWRHRPHWNFAIRMGRDWTDERGYITRIDNITNEIMKRDILEVLSCYRPLNGSKALKSGVQALANVAKSLQGSLRSIVKTGPSIDMLPIVIDDDARTSSGSPTARSPIFNGGKCFRITQPSLFPSFPQQGSWFEVVLDSLRVISEPDKKVIQDLCRESLFKHGMPVVLVTLSDSFIPGGVGDDFRVTEAIRKYAVGMFNKFQIGYQQWNYGILCILISKYNSKVDGVVVFGNDWHLRPEFADVQKRASQLIEECKYQLENHTGGCEPFASLVEELVKFSEELPTRPDAVSAVISTPYKDGSTRDPSPTMSSSLSTPLSSSLSSSLRNAAPIGGQRAASVAGTNPLSSEANRNRAPSNVTHYPPLPAQQ